jgi:hypothetical protein
MLVENPLDENDYPTFYESARIRIPRVFRGTQVLGIIQLLSRLLE